jgi:4-carboxymuconolactone decarboxylase
MRVNVSDEQINAAFELVKDDPAFAESVKAMNEGRRPGEMLQALALRPELLRGFTAISAGHYPGGIVERDLKELIILESSRRNACQFCTGVHIAIAKMMNIGDDPIALLDQPEKQTERQRLALEYTRAATQDSNRVPDELFARLKQQFNDAEIVEITFAIGFINCLNMFNNLLRVTYHGEYEEQTVEKVES